MSRFIPLVLVLSFLFAACAPSVYGSRYNNFDFINGSVFPIPGEGTWYASGEVPAAALDIDLGDIPDRAFSSNEGATFNKALSRFQIIPDQLPEGWSVDFEAVTGVQTLISVKKEGSRTQVRWRDSVAIVLRIKVPTGQTTGHYPIKLAIQAPNGQNMDVFWDTVIDGGELVEVQPSILN